MLRDLRRALDACVDLDRKGLQIVAAHVHAGSPKIIARAPSHGALSDSVTRDGGQTYIAFVRGVRVEWTATACNLGRNAA
jgi:hypothetical protein